MEYQYNQAVWGPPWIWIFGLLLFVSGIVLTAWFLQIVREADRDNTPPREIRGRVERGKRE